MKLAGFWIRSVAHLVDFLCWNLVEVIIEYGLTWIFKLGTVAQQGIGVLASLILIYLFYVELPMQLGSTPGKLLFGIVVIDEKTGNPPSRKQLFGRTCSYLLSYLIIGCGFMMAAFHPQKLALHDVLAGTICKRKNKEESI